FNRSGSQVGTYNFLSSSTMFGEGKTLTVKSFAFFVPSPTDLGSIQIRRGTTILKEIKRSAHAPSVSITSPANGVTWTGTQTLSWSGADQDQEKVLYTVRYSNDGGTTWQSLAANYDRTSLSINSAQLPSGRSCLLRVSATDGTLNFTSKDVSLSVDNGMAIGLLSPSNAGVNVPVGTSIEASLMTPVAETQVTPSTLTLKETYTNTPVAGTLTYSATSKTLVFVPASDLRYSTRYTATVKSGLTDDFGIRLSSDVEWSFTTIADSSDLSIRSLDPAPSSSNSPVNGGITAVFNKEMNSSTFTPSSFMLYDNTAKSAVTGTVTYTSSSKSAMFTPASPLKALNDYRVTLTTAIKSTDNRSLANNYQFFFITGTDSIAGIHLTGAYSETGIDDNNDRLYDWLAIDVTINVIDAGSYSINGKLADKDDNEIVWASSNNLYLNKGLTTVRLKFDGRVINAYRINGPYYLNDLQVYNTSNTNKSEWTSYAYTTKTYQYTEFQTSTIPVVTTFTPADGAIDVPANSAVTATFTRSMNPSSIDSMSFYVVDRANVKVRGTIAYDTASHQVQFTPSAAFHADSVYRVAMTTGIRDVSGTRLLKQYNWSFT
ncbi:MAG TPA: Ig-like domain-containing protein, partial [Bacteroidota bacterium]|nr:Ig-like domain-containing protein [Bacteroidota bacterium]